MPKGAIFGDEPGGNIIHGCTDPQADNYLPHATVEDMSCTYSGQYADCDDPTACNYGEQGICWWPQPGSECGDPWVGGGCTDPNATNYDPNATLDDGSCTYDGDENATVDNGSCDYAYYSELNASNCIPGEMYIDSDSGMTAYCPGAGSGLYGDPLGEWQTGGGWATEGLPEGLSNITADQRNIFDVLPPEVLQHVPPEYWGEIGGSYAGLEERPLWESYLGDIRGLQSGTRTERRNLQENLRGMNLYGGVSQSFAGGGGGVMPGREKTGAMRTFRDFLGGQATEKAGYQLGFQEEAEGFRSQWEEDIQQGYANLLAGDPTQYCTTCGPNQMCMGKEEDQMTDICVDISSLTEEDWSGIQETWLG
jgi:hypothetical protein